MQTAKLFNNGGSQAVRLPKEFRFSGDDVYIKKYQGIVMLLPKESPGPRSSTVWTAFPVISWTRGISPISSRERLCDRFPARQRTCIYL